MTEVINSSTPLFEAAQYRLMADVAAQMDFPQRFLFWKNLPNSIPDLKTYLPALTAAIEREKNPLVLNSLSLAALPTTLSLETADWRQGLVTGWKGQLKAARESFDERKGYRGYEDWERGHQYRCALRGLTLVDKCGLPSGLTCPSVLPTLLSEAHYVREQIREPKQLPPGLYLQLSCLSELANWRPGTNVKTTPAVLKKWGSFWLELYQKGSMDIPHSELHEPIVKGIAAKALLNLMEAGGKEKTGIPAGMETTLLESLTKAIDMAGKMWGRYAHLDWLSWQPRDVTRFPASQLDEMARVRLGNLGDLFKTSGGWGVKREDILCDSLGELLRWDKAGLLAAHDVDLSRYIVKSVDDYLKYHIPKDRIFSGDVIRELSEFVARDKTSSVKAGKKLVHKLEEHWIDECRGESCFREVSHERLDAWEGRIQLHRTGLATEPLSAFHNDMLEAIKKERNPNVRLGLSFWRPEKDTPMGVQEKWERLWEEELKSDNREKCLIAALALLRPDPSSDPMTRQQKLQNVLCALPEEIRSKLSTSETEIMQLAVANPNTVSNVGPNQTGGFGPHPVSTPQTAQTDHPDRTAQRIARSKPQLGG